MTALKLLVIRCKNIETSKQFYEQLQMEFVQEQHDSGVVHYSTMMNGIVFELYPLQKNQPLDDVRLGFQVKNIAEHCVIVDPDGRKVELYPTHHCRF